MKKIVKIKTFAVSALIVLSIVVVPAIAKDAIAVKTLEYKVAQPLEIVAHPQNYLQQKIKIFAVFDKFSTLGLDYKPAFKDSQKYISFLIQRDDVVDHTIPLSEMKIIVKRDVAEKMADIESGDKIEFTGKVFSCAMNDPWIEVENVKILTPKVKKTIDTPKEK